MGPAHGSEGAGSGTILATTPPKFHAGKKDQYREDVQLWVTLLASLAKAEDKAAKSICVALAETLVSQLPHEQRSLVRASIADGDIVTTKSSFKAQLKATRKIVKLIASDSSTEHIERVQTAFKGVTLCVRGKKETFRAFATRFYAKARTYLRICGGSEDEPAGLLLALTFITNARLSADTEATVKLRLQAEADGPASASQNGSGPVDTYDDMSSGSDEADYGTSGSEPDDPEETTAEGEAMTRAQRDTARKHRAKARRAARKAKLTVPNDFFTGVVSQTSFTLNDVYHALLVVPDAVVSDPVATTESVAEVVNKALMSRFGKEGLDKIASNQKRCSRCKRKGHEEKDCRTRKVCSFCDKQGHEERECFVKHGIGSDPKERRQFYQKLREDREGIEELDIADEADSPQRKRAKTENSPAAIFRRGRRS